MSVMSILQVKVIASILSLKQKLTPKGMFEWDMEKESCASLDSFAVLT